VGESIALMWCGHMESTPLAVVILNQTRRRLVLLSLPKSGDAAAGDVPAMGHVDRRATERDSASSGRVFADTRNAKVAESRAAVVPFLVVAADCAVWWVLSRLGSADRVAAWP